jgi:hypothetical protein
VVEDEDVVRSELDRAAAAGEEFVAFEGEGGKGVRIAVVDVRPLGDDRWWISGQHR